MPRLIEPWPERGRSCQWALQDADASPSDSATVPPTKLISAIDVYIGVTWVFCIAPSSHMSEGSVALLSRHDASQATKLESFGFDRTLTDWMFCP
jgi:hypothetical protein